MAAKLWWIMRKDLTCEYRARRAWPAMLLLGALVAMLFGMQMDLPAEGKRRIVGSLLWLATVLAGMRGLDRAFTSEREQGCWEGLLLCPISSTTVYLGKLAANVVVLAGLQCVLIPLFVLFSDVPLLAHPGAMLLVAGLGNIALASVGTLLGAVTAGARRGGNLLVLLMLPMVAPVIVAAAEATRLMLENDFAAPWWRWIQLLAAAAILFTTAGIMLFDVVIEE
ncbi:MAG: heme exporter protein CcmB [Planctomycetes bacterium]|nr:heme exporter protein CcmB [Planctomycetota bacterium]